MKISTDEDVYVKLTSDKAIVSSTEDDGSFSLTLGSSLGSELSYVDISDRRVRALDSLFLIGDILTLWDTSGSAKLTRRDFDALETGE